jgi:23S rRNA pseudouridine1911/1915/1917 synthase
LIRFTVTDEQAGMRLDKMMAAEYPDASRSFVQRMIEEGGVTVNGRVPSKSEKLKAGDEILITPFEVKELSAEPQNIPLDIRYEDDDLLVVNKPRGMVVHPAAGNYSGTLVNALLSYCKNSLSGINGVIRPGIVHRIDKDTSGLLIVAKNDFAHCSLAKQIKEHSFKREYSAVVHGRLKEPAGTINAPIGRSERDRKKMCVTYKNSREATTHFEVIYEYEKFSLVRLRLETGRTHQIRVHMAYIGHPVAGDTVYGPKNGVRLGGQCLHAGLIGFCHPRDGRYIEIVSELPDYFESFLGSLTRPLSQ